MNASQMIQDHLQFYASVIRSSNDVIPQILSPFSYGKSLKLVGFFEVTFLNFFLSTNITLKLKAYSTFLISLNKW